MADDGAIADQDIYEGQQPTGAGRKRPSGEFRRAAEQATLHAPRWNFRKAESEVELPNIEQLLLTSPPKGVAPMDLLSPRCWSGLPGLPGERRVMFRSQRQGAAPLRHIA